MAKNWSRNWPAKSGAPVATRADQESGGRGRNRAGTAAIRNLSAVSWGGEKLSSPILVATKASPQMTATSSARATWEGFRARPALTEDGAAVVARVDDRRPRGGGGQGPGGLPAERLPRPDGGGLASRPGTPWRRPVGGGPQ